MIFICKLLNVNWISRGSFLRILYCLFSHICFILQFFGEGWHLCCGLLRVSGQVEFVCFIFFLSVLAQFKFRFISCLRMSFFMPVWLMRTSPRLLQALCSSESFQTFLTNMFWIWPENIRNYFLWFFFSLSLFFFFYSHTVLCTNLILNNITNYKAVDILCFHC